MHFDVLWVVSLFVSHVYLYLALVHTIDVNKPIKALLWLTHFSVMAIECLSEVLSERSGLVAQRAGITRHAGGLLPLLKIYPYVMLSQLVLTVFILVTTWDAYYLLMLLPLAYEWYQVYIFNKLYMNLWQYVRYRVVGIQSVLQSGNKASGVNNKPVKKRITF